LDTPQYTLDMSGDGSAGFEYSVMATAGEQRIKMKQTVYMSAPEPTYNTPTIGTIPGMATYTTAFDNMPHPNELSALRIDLAINYSSTTTIYNFWNPGIVTVNYKDGTVSWK
jgi:hypothetical protein